MWHALGEAVAPIKLKTVSANVFTHPEIATVGVQEKTLTDDQDVDVVRLPLATNARAKMSDLHDGFVKLFTRRSTGVVIGGVVVAPGASELVLPIALAVAKGLTAADLAQHVLDLPVAVRVDHRGRPAADGGRRPLLTGGPLGPLRAQRPAEADGTELSASDPVRRCRRARAPPMQKQMPSARDVLAPSAGCCAPSRWPRPSPAPPSSRSCCPAPSPPPTSSPARRSSASSCRSGPRASTRTPARARTPPRARSASWRRRPATPSASPPRTSRASRPARPSRSPSARRCDDEAADEHGVEPARTVLASDLLAAPVGRPLRPRRAGLTNEVTVVLVAPAGAPEDGTPPRRRRRPRSTARSPTSGPSRATARSALGVTAAARLDDDDRGLRRPDRRCGTRPPPRSGSSPGAGKHLMLYVTEAAPDCAYALAAGRLRARHRRPAVRAGHHRLGDRPRAGPQLRPGPLLGPAVRRRRRGRRPAAPRPTATSTTSWASPGRSSAR